MCMRALMCYDDSGNAAQNNLGIATHNFQGNAVHDTRGNAALHYWTLARSSLTLRWKGWYYPPNRNLKEQVRS